MSHIKELIRECDSTSVLLILFILFISIFYFYLSAHNEIVGLIADDAIYLLMTDYFSPYYSSLSSSAAFVMNTSQFPPLYPLLMALLGASSEKLVLAHLITTSCLVGGVVVYFLWIYEEQRNINAGISLALIFLCSPATLLMNIDLWSEHLYLLLTMCSLFFVEKARKNNKYLLAASISIALLPILRMVGITFVAAFFLYLYIQKIKYKYKYISISIIPLLVWEIISVSFYSTDVYQNTLTSFSQYDFWPIIKYFFSVQVFDLWLGWHENFDIQKNIFSGVVCALILLTSIIIWFSRLLDKRLDSFYLLFYFIVIWIWPDNNHNMRFMFVAFPILIYYSYLFLFYVLKHNSFINLKIIINYAVVFIILVTFIPTNLYAITRLVTQVPPSFEQYKNTRFWVTRKNNNDAENSVKIIDRMVLSYVEASQFIPKNQCVYTVHQESFMFYSRRLAFPLPLPKEVKDNEIIRHLTKCKYIHVLHTNSNPQYPGGYPISKLENNFDYLMLTRMSDDINSAIVGALLKLH